MMERLSLKIHGIVQGVGFRPFVHKLVRDHGLRGYIRNCSSGVELELEGERSSLEKMLKELPEKAPRLALIQDIEAQFSGELKGFEDFRIIESSRDALINTLVSPDICVCQDCLREMRDRGDRRYGYPFINCTNCGPRFTIIKDLPYDRAKTSMAVFPMCPDCEREYGDIEDRRYHAQPDCCEKCGPRLFYMDARAGELPGDAIETARQQLKAGRIVAVKGLGGMHLACRWDDEALVRRLRRRKQRDEKPFALMCRDVECARKLCLVSPEEEKILTGYQRPIVLLRKKEPGLEYLSENAYLGLMLPYTPLHYLLMGEDIDMLVMTSANLSDTPIMYRNEEALRDLRGIADGFLLHDREIQTRCDDSLCWEMEGREYFVRRSRGYVPYPLIMKRELKSILACGAEQKASFCLSRGSHVFQSQHIGDLKKLETLENYRQQVEHFKKLFDIVPEAAACDMHPDYLSTAYAEELGLPLVKVQHHHAHMCSCMADNSLEGETIALVWDGTGLGSDGSSWGGECLAGGFKEFIRFGHILPMAMPGGDRAVKETERLAFSLLEASGLDSSRIPGAEVYKKMLETKLNCPMSSGMGRLFDGAAAILGLKTRCSYEGQGAVLLEAAAAEDENAVYPYVLAGSPLVFDWREMIRAMVRDLEEGLGPDITAARFMNSLVDMAAETVKAAGAETGLDRVCLSGGSFQNMYIMRRLPRRLRSEGFQVYHHCRVSCNDEGIALGQLMAAEAKLRG